MPLSALEKRARIFLRATRIAASRKQIVEETIGLEAGVFAPLVQGILDYIGEMKTADYSGFASSFPTLDLSQLASEAVERLRWIFASRYLRTRAVARAALRGDAPAGALSFSAAALETIETGAFLGFYNLADPVLPDPVERLLRALGERLELNLPAEEYYRLGALERTRATTVWGLAEESARRGVMKQLEESLKNGEPFYTAEPGKSSFYSRVRDKFGERYGVAGGSSDKYPLAGWHLETIFKTNLATITNRANMDEYWELRDVFPYVRYLNGDPVFEACKWLDGKYFRIDDPVVQNYVPPLHFNCDTYVVPVMESELPSGKERTKSVVTGAQIPPNAQPEVYAGPFTDPSKGKAEPFGQWRPPNPIPGAAPEPPHPPPPPLAAFIGGVKADNKIALNALRQEREAFLAGIAGAPAKGDDLRKLKRINARIRDLSDADKLLTSLLEPSPSRIDKLSKPFLPARTHDPGATFERIHTAAETITYKIAQLPDENSPLYARLVADINAHRSGFLRDLETHVMSVAQVEEIKTLLLSNLTFGAGFTTAEQQALRDAIRFLPLKVSGRALTAKTPLNVISIVYPGSDKTAYVPKDHLIQLTLLPSGKLPSDFRAAFLHEMVHAASATTLGIEPISAMKWEKMLIARRPGLEEWLKKQHPNAFKQIHHPYGIQLEQGNYDELFSCLVEAAFSWTDNTLEPEVLTPSLSKSRRLRQVLRLESWRLLTLGYLREF